EELRQALSDFGYQDARVQRTESNEFVVRITGLEEEATAASAEQGGEVIGPAPPAEEQSARAQLEDDLRDRFGSMIDASGSTTNAETGEPVGFQDFSSVSESVSRDIGRNAGFAIGVAAVAILLYISWAFRHMPKPFRYGVAALVALAHDALLVIGAFSILGKAFDTEINTMFITGLLTVIGFSVHDTIVVFDRIRENIATHPGMPMDEAVNRSLTETLSRSLNTSLTVIVTIVAMLLLGGGGIQSLLLVLLIGITAGTYSSIGVASQILVSWDKGDFGRAIRFLTFRRPAVASEAS
ncbi:MAG TPA: protein translocase subunit SecF, partial [Dehalococcoidia bacterium]|nr:protein translocase subunit SecF [Dehalococcoidia bacterium]